LNAVVSESIGWSPGRWVLYFATGGKSEHQRTAGWLTARRGDPTEKCNREETARTVDREEVSATEPTLDRCVGDGETVR